ncbi:MAG: hypothetical protein AAGF27_02380 [Pseudomonadota bacterium]
MASEVVKERNNKSGISLERCLTGVSVLVAIFAAIFVYLTYDVSNRQHQERVVLTKQLYEARLTDEGDLQLTAGDEDVFRPQALSLRPRFLIPGKYSDEDTLGDTISFARDEIRITNSDDGVTATVAGAKSTVCSEGQTNRSQCSNQVIIQQYYVEFLFDGDARHGFWFDASS